MTRRNICKNWERKVRIRRTEKLSKHVKKQDKLVKIRTAKIVCKHENG